MFYPCGENDRKHPGRVDDRLPPDKIAPSPQGLPDDIVGPTARAAGVAVGGVGGGDGRVTADTTAIRTATTAIAIAISIATTAAAAAAAAARSGSGAPQEHRLAEHTPKDGDQAPHPKPTLLAPTVPHTLINHDDIKLHPIALVVRLHQSDHFVRARGRLRGPFPATLGGQNVCDCLIRFHRIFVNHQ